MDDKILNKLADALTNISQGETNGSFYYRGATFGDSGTVCYHFDDARETNNSDICITKLTLVENLGAKGSSFDLFEKSTDINGNEIEGFGNHKVGFFINSKQLEAAIESNLKPTSEQKPHMLKNVSWKEDDTPAIANPSTGASVASLPKPEITR